MAKKTFSSFFRKYGLLLITLKYVFQEDHEGLMVEDLKAFENIPVIPS